MNNDSSILLKEYIEALCYSKDITWTQTEILEAIANAIRETNLVIIVTNLPETDIQINKLYLVPSTNPRNTNLFDIFFYANGGWEQVDGLSFNIEDYYTKDEIDTILEDKANRNHNHTDATVSTSGFMSSSDKAKLNGISAGANKTVVDNNLSTISTNPVQNKIVKEALDTKVNIEDLDDVAFSGSYNDLSNTPHIPDKVSELENDSGYLTTHQSLANYYNKTEVDSSLNAKVDKVAGKQLSSNDYTTAEKNKVATIDDKVNIVDLDDVAFSGSYNDLSNTPHIPDKVSELTNDSGYLTTHQSLNSKTINIEKQSTPESGYSATYVIKQGGTAISPKINIPKDFLVKSGTVKTVTTANTPVNGYNVGEKYLDFVINAKDNSDSDEHLYINVKDLVDNYTADEVTLTLANKQFKIKDGGVSFTKLDNSLQSTINNKSNNGHTHSKSEITDFPSTMTPSSHSHGSLSNAGTLNSDITSVNKIAVTDSSNNLKTISKLPADKVTHQDISNKIDTAGTGLSKSGTSLNHSNSVTAQTSSALKKIKYDAQGHITGTDNVAKSDITSLGIPAQDTTYTHPSTHASTMITEASALSNIGTNANSTQHAVNEAINTKIDTLATKESIDDIVAGDVDLTGYIKDTDSRLTDSRTPKSHAHGNISNDGVISGQASKNVVTDANGKITTEAKPTIPSGNATASNIKMNGTQSAGSLGTFAKADHVHPVDTSRAASSHTHTQSEISDLDKSKVSISRNLSSGTKVATITIDGTATDLYCNNDTNTTYSAVTQSANGLMTSADKQKLDKSMSISAGNIAGTTSVYTATLTGVTLTHGTLIVLYNAIGANAANATLNVNGLGAKPIYYNASAIPAGRFPNKATCLFMYNTTIVSTGCWQLIYSYDSNNTYTAASATPTEDSASGDVGTSAKYAREDHVHPKSSIYAESSHTHTKSQITDFPTSMAPTSHSHGSLANGGTLNSDITSVNKVAVTDSSNNLKTISKVPFENLNISKSDITGLGIPGSDTNTTYTADNSSLQVSSNQFSIKTGGVTSSHIADKTIVNGDIADTTIQGGKLVNGTISATQLASNSVETAKIKDANVTNAKLSDLSNLVTEYIVGTHGTTATPSWTGTSTKISSLQKGQVIYFKMTSAGTSAGNTLNLTLANGSTTGAKDIYYNATAKLTTHFPINTILELVYDGTNWLCTAIQNTNNYDRIANAGQVVGGEAITVNSLIYGKSDGKYYKIASNGTLDIRYPILWLASALASGGTATNLYSAYTSVNIQNTVSGKTLTASQMCYLEGTLNKGIFTISSNVLVTSLTNGKYYIPLGFMTSTTNLRFNNFDKTVYKYTTANGLVPVGYSYDDLLDKPTSFTPSSHTHTKSQITDFPTSMAPTAHTDSNGAYGKATTSVWGHTKLSSATNSTDETMSATPKAVKAAYDLANGKPSLGTTATTAAKGNHTHTADTIGMVDDGSRFIEEWGSTDVQTALETIYENVPSYDDFSAYIPKANNTNLLLANGSTKAQTDFATSGHSHGNINNNGVIANQVNKNVVTDANGKITTEAKPTIPTKTSQLTNDSGFLTSHQSITGKADKTGGVAQVTDANANNYTNIGSLSSGATQQAINNAINTALGGKQASGSYATASHGHGKITSGGTLSETTTSVKNVVVTDTTNNNLRVINKVPFANLNISSTDIANLGVEITDTVYTHPPSHASSMITEATALDNLGTSANATQATINSKLNGKFGTVIPNGTSSAHNDLNKYNIPGFYYQSANANTTYIDNLPNNTRLAFTLLVEYHTGTYGVKQTLTFYNTSDPQTFIRIGAYNGTATTGWGAWKEIAWTSDIPSAYTHPNSGVTAGTNYNGNQTPSFGATFNIPKLTFNAQGHITASANSTVKIPSLPTASTSQAGIIQIGTGASNAAAGNHDHDSDYYKLSDYNELHNLDGFCNVKSEVGFDSSYTTVADSSFLLRRKGNLVCGQVHLVATGGGAIAHNTRYDLLNGALPYGFAPIDNVTVTAPDISSFSSLIGNNNSSTWSVGILEITGTGNVGFRKILKNKGPHNFHFNFSYFANEN